MYFTGRGRRARSDNNPQGFMVEALNIVENKDIATYDR